MDSDDISHPERLRRQINFLEQHVECLFVGSIYGLITPNQKYLAPKETFTWRYLQARDITLATCLFADPSAVFDRMSALEVDLYDSHFENEKPLWYKLLSREKGAVLGEPLHYVRWRLGSHSRSGGGKRGFVNEEIRRRYDPESAYLKSDGSRNGKVSLRLARRGLDYYLLAGDNRAARKLAAHAWKTRPASSQSLELVAKAVLKRRSLRLWRQPAEDPTFVSVEKPW
jgi:hypothetical protein